MGITSKTIFLVVIYMARFVRMELARGVTIFFKSAFYDIEEIDFLFKEVAVTIYIYIYIYRERERERDEID